MLETGFYSGNDWKSTLHSFKYDKDHRLAFMFNENPEKMKTFFNMFNVSKQSIIGSPIKLLQIVGSTLLLSISAVIPALKNY